MVTVVQEIAGKCRAISADADKPFIIGGSNNIESGEVKLYPHIELAGVKLVLLGKDTVKIGDDVFRIFQTD